MLTDQDSHLEPIRLKFKRRPHFLALTPLFRALIGTLSNEFYGLASSVPDRPDRRHRIHCTVRIHWIRGRSGSTGGVARPRIPNGPSAKLLSAVPQVR